MATTDKEHEGLKYDGEKLRLDLLPCDALLDIAAVLNYGANKYSARNWEKGLVWHRPYAACLRHLFAWWSGETYDQETGLNHLAHAACNLLFLLHYSNHSAFSELDDRPSSTAVTRSQLLQSLGI